MAANAECAETVGTYMSDGQNSLHLVMDAKLGVSLFNVFLSLYKALWSTCDCVKLGVLVFNVSSSLQPSIDCGFRASAPAHKRVSFLAYAKLIRNCAECLESMCAMVLVCGCKQIFFCMKSLKNMQL